MTGPSACLCLDQNEESTPMPAKWPCPYAHFDLDQTTVQDHVTDPPLPPLNPLVHFSIQIGHYVCQEVSALAWRRRHPGHGHAHEHVQDTPERRRAPSHLA